MGVDAVSQQKPVICSSTDKSPTYDYGFSLSSVSHVNKSKTHKSNDHLVSGVDVDVVSQQKPTVPKDRTSEYFIGESSICNLADDCLHEIERIFNQVWTDLKLP